MRCVGRGIDIDFSFYLYHWVVLDIFQLPGHLSTIFFLQVVLIVVVVVIKIIIVIRMTVAPIFVSAFVLQTDTKVMSDTRPGLHDQRHTSSSSISVSY